MLYDRRDAAIVSSLVRLARGLSLGVTAEGVENIEQALLLKDLHCDKLQGYYFSAPVRAHAIDELLKRRWAIDTIVSLPEADIST